MIQDMKQPSIYKTDPGKKAIQKFYEALLEDWPKQNKSFHLITSYGSTFVIENGNAEKPVIVLLHGTGSNAAMYKGEAEEYAKDYHVYSIDIIGE